MCRLLYIVGRVDYRTYSSRFSAFWPSTAVPKSDPRPEGTVTLPAVEAVFTLKSSSFTLKLFQVVAISCFPPAGKHDNFLPPVLGVSSLQRGGFAPCCVCVFVPCILAHAKYLYLQVKVHEGTPAGCLPL